MIDMDEMPLYEIHTMYYLFWKEKDEESKMTDEQKGAKALGQVIENSM